MRVLPGCQLLLPQLCVHMCCAAIVGCNVAAELAVGPAHMSVCTAAKEEKHKEVKNRAIAVHLLYLHGR